MQAETRMTMNLPKHIDTTLDRLATLLGTDRSSAARLAVVELAERFGVLDRPAPHAAGTGADAGTEGE